MAIHKKNNGNETFRPMTSSEIDDVRFHCKGHGVWYKGLEVDMLLDKIKETLEYYENRTDNAQNAPHTIEA